jgi:hypothetical protein
MAASWMAIALAQVQLGYSFASAGEACSRGRHAVTRHEMPPIHHAAI